MCGGTGQENDIYIIRTNQASLSERYKIPFDPWHMPLPNYDILYTNSIVMVLTSSYL